jgi:glycosyltransferase involved in cell wall biosynthesis
VKRRVLVVGQTPPPFHGQAIAIGLAVEGPYREVEVVHVRLEFSRAMDEVGRFRLRKLLHLAAVLGRIVAARLQRRFDVLYYSPAGPDRTPMWRDFAILVVARRLVPRTLFHFHASGLSTLYPRLSRLERLLFRAAYHHPEGVIRMSPHLEEDGRALAAQREWIVPYGIPDYAAPYLVSPGPPNQPPVILWLSNLYESKGIGVLIEACRRLRERSVAFHLEVVGAFPAAAAQEELRRRVEVAGLSDRVAFRGALTGDAKWRAFANADLFCLPSFYAREGMPLVLLEAMQFALPVVATSWRGLQDVVLEDETGLLVPMLDPGATADALAVLLADPERARAMGARARQEYLRTYTAEAYRAGLERVFLAV